MRTYKVVYSIANKPGRKVAFYQNACPDFARMQAYDDLGGGSRNHFGSSRSLNLIKV